VATKFGTVATKFGIVATKFGTVATKYYLSHQIKKNEMYGSCGMYEGGERCIQDFGGET
jgi:hypothetical protein